VPKTKNKEFKENKNKKTHQQKITTKAMQL